MSPGLTFLYIVYFFSIILHVISVVIVAFFIIPLQIKEALVQDGLSRLRKLLLLFGIDIVGVGIASILSLGIRFFINDMVILRYAVVFLVLVHAIGFLGFSLIGYSMYTSQYTPEIKEAHKIAHKIEKKKKK